MQYHQRLNTFLYDKKKETSLPFDSGFNTQDQEQFARFVIAWSMVDLTIMHCKWFMSVFLIHQK